MPRPSQDRIKVNVYLQRNVLEGLKKIAMLKGTSYAELIRQATQDYLLREAKRVIEEKRQIDAVTTQEPGVPASFEEDGDDPRAR
jgi:metal-responsive CopG/Arc/MetJ family transcriptional regulator